MAAQERDSGRRLRFADAGIAEDIFPERQNRNSARHGFNPVGDGSRLAANADAIDQGVFKGGAGVETGNSERPQNYPAAFRRACRGFFLRGNRFALGRDFDWEIFTLIMRWINYTTTGLSLLMANFGETLRPEFVLKHRDTAHKPLLLIEHYAPDQDLEKPVAGKTWKASPGTRMMELLHATDVPLGLVTNGEQWMIVYAPRGETTGFGSWYADLWMQEPITLRAFHSLLHLRRFLGVDEPETLAALYAESSKDQQEVTDQLGYQVRRAVEMLVQAFDRIDAESDRKLLAGVKEKDLYDSALTIMMRLVFLFSAEERGLLLLGEPQAVSTLAPASLRRHREVGRLWTDRAGRDPAGTRATKPAWTGTGRKFRPARAIRRDDGRRSLFRLYPSVCPVLFGDRFGN